MNGDQDRGQRRHRGLAISGIVFVVLILLIGGAVLLSLRQALNPAHSDTVRRTFGHIDRLVVTSRSNDVTVVAAPAGSDTVTITGKLQWNRKRPTVRPVVSGHRLHVESSCAGELHWGFSTCRADLTVAVPAGTALDLRAESGDASVRGLTGAVDVEASSGNLKLTGLTGPVHAATQSGGIAATGLRSAKVRATASSGDINLAFGTAPDDVTATASSGNIDIAVPETPDGYAVTYQVSSGDPHVTVARHRTSPHRLRAEASSGDIKIETARPDGSAGSDDPDGPPTAPTGR